MGSIVGAKLGARVGAAVGIMVGASVVAIVGANDGSGVGALVGPLEGELVGCEDGEWDSHIAPALIFFKNTAVATGSQTTTRPSREPQQQGCGSARSSLSMSACAPALLSAPHNLYADP